MGVRRKLWRAEEWLPPLWLTTSLTFLGAWFIVAKPLGADNWLAYVWALIVATVVAVVSRRRYFMEIIDRTESGIITTRIGRKRDLLNDAPEASPSPSESESTTPDERKMALGRDVARMIAQGWRVETQNDYQVVLRKGTDVQIAEVDESAQISVTKV